jgi:tungstate transport system substrate-binding protein
MSTVDNGCTTAQSRSRRVAPGLFLALLALWSGAACSRAAHPAQTEIILATTTSTQDSGLLDELVPVFEEETGYVVKVIAVGTGQALQMGQDGNADVLLVHAPESELALIESGTAVDRRLVMHNDFVLVGPAADPAGVAGAATPGEALSRIVDAGAAFASRADDSGTHKKELELWLEAGREPGGAWYLETGQGMGATLRIATERQAYSLTDRATYLALRDTLDLAIVFEGAPSLLNVYHVMRVNPERYPAVNVAGALAWSDFMVSDETQAVIAGFGVDRFGQPLFFPDAGRSEAEFGLEE